MLSWRVLRRNEEPCSVSMLPDAKRRRSLQFCQILNAMIADFDLLAQRFIKDSHSVLATGIQGSIAGVYCIERGQDRLLRTVHNPNTIPVAASVIVAGSGTLVATTKE